MIEELTVMAPSICRNTAREQEASGGKNLLSPPRLAEMAERLAFILRIRAPEEATIVRLEASARQSQMPN
jgi:glycine cleavage system regulatory protein